MSSNDQPDERRVLPDRPARSVAKAKSAEQAATAALEEAQAEIKELQGELLGVYKKLKLLTQIKDTMFESAMYLGGIHNDEETGGHGDVGVLYALIQLQKKCNGGVVTEEDIDAVGVTSSGKTK